MALCTLAQADALERFSPLLGEPLLLIDFEQAGDSGAGIADLAPALHNLRRLPAPSIAIASPAVIGSWRDVVDACDVVVTTADEAIDIATRIAARPLAAMAAVQLLRHSEGRTLHDGLIAESLTYSMLQAGPEFAEWLRERGAPRPDPNAGRPSVRIERTNDELVLILDRPERRNAFSAAMRDALVEALQVAIADRSITRVRVRGEGPSFCAGGDLDEFGSLPDPATAHAIRSMRHAGRLLADCSARVCFEVHGACVGAGVELPAFAARVVAAEDAFFQLPEVSMGLVPGAGGTASIPRRIGRQRTAWLALTGARIDALTALDWGLVDALQPTP